MSVDEIAGAAIMSLGYIMMVCSLIPLLRSDKWFIRIFDYPRSQKFWITIGLMIAFVFIADLSENHDRIFLGLMLLNAIYLLTLIWRYTPLASIQMKKSDDASVSPIRIFIANVFQDNEKFSLCSGVLTKADPDIVLLVETNDQWLKELEHCMSDFPYRVQKPQSNTYGMILYSKLKIERTSLRYLVEKDVPSITADIKTNDGQLFRLYCLHPRPPVPGESAQSTERDAEILIVGKEAKKCKIPVIVAGDLNDVAWSYTTNLFLKISGLLDPRIGRGFYSTFHAAYALFRWPLDHVFCSTHFTLNHLRRLPFIGSDHFPILIDVSLSPNPKKENVENVKSADEEDLQLAEEKIEEAV